MIEQGEAAPNTILVETDADGNPVNPRGRVKDTTDLQDSIREAGRIIEPILVRRDERGQLWVVNGHRRLTAARILNMPVPYVVTDMPHGADSIDLMLASNVHQAFPAIVLDGKGCVVGGVASAVGKKLMTGRTRESLARLMGIRPDVVSAYDRLLAAPVEVRKAVATGRLSMTAFARMKHAPADVQAEIVTANGDEAVTVDAVRDGLRQAKQREQAALNAAVPEEKSVVQELNDIIATLRRLLAQPLAERELYLMERICELTQEVCGD